MSQIRSLQSQQTVTSQPLATYEAIERLSEKLKEKSTLTRFGNTPNSLFSLPKAEERADGRSDLHDCLFLHRPFPGLPSPHTNATELVFLSHHDRLSFLVSSMAAKERRFQGQRRLGRREESFCAGRALGARA